MAMDGLKNFYQMQTPMPHMDLTAGTDYVGGPEPLIVLPVPVGSWLEEGLHSKVAVNPQIIHSGQSAGAPALPQAGPTQP